MPNTKKKSSRIAFEKILLDFVTWAVADFDESSIRQVVEADWSGLKDKWEVGKLRQLSVGNSSEKFIERRREGGGWRGRTFSNCLLVYLFSDGRDLMMKMMKMMKGRSTDSVGLVARSQELPFSDLCLFCKVGGGSAKA